MKKLIIALALVVGVLGADAHAKDDMKIFFCVGTEKYTISALKNDLPRTIKVQYRDDDDSLILYENSTNQFEPIARVAHLGSLEIVGDGTPKKLVVTKKNNKVTGMSLTGTAFGDYGDVYSLRIDTWENGNPFIFFDVFTGSVVTGECK